MRSLLMTLGVAVVVVAFVGCGGGGGSSPSPSGASVTTNGGQLNSATTPSGYIKTPATPTADALVPANSVLILQDSAPWGYHVSQDILTADGIPFQVSPVLMTKYLGAKWRLVVISGDQTTSTYNSLNVMRSQLEAYVKKGGTVLCIAAMHGFNGGGGWTLPFGITVPNSLDTRQTVDFASDLDEFTSPNTVTDPGLDNWLFSAHGVFSIPGALAPSIEMCATSSGQPVLAEYEPVTAGVEGTMIFTTQPLEFAAQNGRGDAHMLLENLLLASSP